MKRARSGSGARDRVGAGGSPRRGGFSLVEVLVALVVLEVGLLGVVGLTLLAQRRMAEAAVLVRAVGTAEALADSLLGVTADGSAAGERAAGTLRLRWTAGEGSVRVEVLPSEGPDAEPLYRLDATSGEGGAP